MVRKGVPLYEYELRDGDCRICGGRLALNRPVSAPPLEKCPLCKKAVRRVYSAPNTPRATRAPSVSEAKAAGFTVFKRVGKGEYERQ